MGGVGVNESDRVEIICPYMVVFCFGLFALEEMRFFLLFLSCACAILSP